MAEADKLNIDSIIARLLEVRGSKPGKNVQLTDNEIRGLCLKSREIFLSQPILLELEAPLKGSGSSPDLQSMEQIRRIMRPTDVPLWSDSDKEVMGWGDNDRGVSFTFLHKHNLDLICRAYQVVEDGYEFFAKCQLVTLFSAPNYCGEFDNAGAMMSVDETLMCSFQHHRKKLTGRRLDYDCKRRKQEKGGTVTDAEVQMAVEKFEESKQLAETAMHNVLDNDVEQISELPSFIVAELEYHRQCASILESLTEILKSKCAQAQSRPRSDHVPRRIMSDYSNGFNRSPPGSSRFSTSSDLEYYPATSPTYATPTKATAQPCAEALYDFEAENEGELSFKEGNTINLMSRIDENWLEGNVNGKTGFFPVSYVKIIVDVPE